MKDLIISGYKRIIIGLSMLLLNSILWGNGTSSGITFYAGFEDSIDATLSLGNPKGTSKGKRVVFEPGLRGKALLTGDGEALIEYEADKNLPLPEGSIELWFKPLDWIHPCWGFHIFVRADGEDNAVMLLYKFVHLQGDFLFYLTDGKGGIAMSQPPTKRRQFELPGTWHQLVAVWSEDEIVCYLDGARAKAVPLRFSFPKRMLRFTLGDDPWKEAASIKTNPPEIQATAESRNAHTLLDEVYIYSRALTDEEVLWSFANKDKRPPGSDIPREVIPAIKKIQLEPDLEGKKLLVELKANIKVFPDAEGGDIYVKGPDGFSKVESFILKSDGYCQKEILCDYSTLSSGTLEVKAVLKNREGKILGEGKDSLILPGPPEWRGNTIGITSHPPRPFLPVKVRPDSKGFTCWGREIVFDENGFISQITSGKQNLLSKPLAFEVVIQNIPVSWTGTVKKVKESPCEVVWEGKLLSSIGELKTVITGEYDGMVRYDFTLTPKEGTTVDRMELKLPVNAEIITLSYLAISPEGQVHPDIYSLIETIQKTGGQPEMIGKVKAVELPWLFYAWVGNEDGGISGVVESDEAWDNVDRKDMFRIEPEGKTIYLVWSFARNRWKLPNPWKFSIGIQATPTKDPQASLRSRRFGKPEWIPGGNTYILTLWYPPSPYFGYIGISNPKEFNEYLEKSYISKGVSVVPYLLLTYMDVNVPEYRFYFKKYRNSEKFARESRFFWGQESSQVVVPPVPDYIDYVCWKAHQLLNEVNFRGLYFDLSAVYPCDSEAAGLGYIRNGIRRPAYPVFAVRKMYQRMYTMLREIEKEKGYEMYMVNHQGPWAWLGTYCDFVWVGEGFKEDYRRIFTPVLLRNLKGSHLGYRALWLPQPPATGVIGGNNPEQPSKYLYGMLLLHDMGISAYYCNIKVLSEMYKAIDRFGGIADAEFLPYWKKEGVKGGDDEKGILCSAYVKKEGALLCAVNVSDRQQETLLTLDTSRLHITSKPKVTNLFTGEAFNLSGNTLEITLSAYDYVLMHIQ